LKKRITESKPPPSNMELPWRGFLEELVRAGGFSKEPS